MKSHTEFSYIIAHLDTFSTFTEKTLEENKEHTNKEKKLKTCILQPDRLNDETTKSKEGCVQVALS